MFIDHGYCHGDISTGNALPVDVSPVAIEIRGNNAIKPFNVSIFLLLIRPRGLRRKIEIKKTELTSL